MAAPPDDQEPQYTLYRARPRLFKPRGGVGPDRPREPRREEKPRRRRRITPRRVLAYVALAVVGWLLLSLVLFMVSAQIESSKTSAAADAQLTGGGFPLTSPNTILVLGSDARLKGTHEAGAQTIGEPSRSDSIMLMRIGGGANATLSIPRDTVVNIPGHGPDKINAAYAIGGPALAIRTVEQFLDIKINHLVEVNFENFPQLIDSLGGITVKTGCIHSELNGGRRNGGSTLKLRAGTHHLNGKQALILARTRHNLCNPAFNDLNREANQQKILAGIKSRVFSPTTFFRLPWVAWSAPKAVRSDMRGPSLLGLAGAALIGGNAKSAILKPTGAETLPNGGAALTVDEASKQRAVEKLLAG
ncbi:MAG TPA: LCP family protein [Solirubrobacteraceae bacterium]|jgi:LCP family protein required for cell wall assembly